MNIVTLKGEENDMWVLGQEAASLVSVYNKREIIPAYIRLLSKMGKVRTKKLDGRTRVYFKADVVNLEVKSRGEGQRKHRALEKEA